MVFTLIIFLFHTPLSQPILEVNEYVSSNLTVFTMVVDDTNDTNDRKIVEEQPPVLNGVQTNIWLSSVEVHFITSVRIISNFLGKYEAHAGAFEMWRLFNYLRRY